jgi:hypothetical protein
MNIKMFVFGVTVVLYFTLNISINSILFLLEDQAAPICIGNQNTRSNYAQTTRAMNLFNLYSNYI